MPASEIAHSSPARSPMSDATATLLERYLAAQLKGQRQEALRLLVEEGMGAGVSVPDLEL